MEAEKELEIATYMLVFFKTILPETVFNSALQAGCMAWAAKHPDGTNDNLPPGWMLTPGESDES